MIHFHEVDLSKLASKQQPLYEELRFPKTFSIFDFEVKEGRQIALVAFNHNKPVGMIVAFAYPAVIQALLASFYVLPDFRHQGIGKELMQRLLSLLLPLGVKIVELHYDSWELTAPFLEKLLAQTGWLASKLLTRRYYFSPDSFHPSWFEASYPTLPSNLSLFPWMEATHEEIKAAQQLIDSHSKLSEISPFSTRYPLEPLNSLGLRSTDGLAGWMITHRLEPDLIRYSALYVSPQLRTTGASIALLKESIGRHVSNEKKTRGLAEINFYRSPEHWLKFVGKRLAPFSTHIEEVKCAFFLNDQQS